LTKEEMSAIIKEAEKTGTKAVCRKYGIRPSNYSVWHSELTGTHLTKRFSREDKLRVLEEGYRNGISRVCKSLSDSPHKLPTARKGRAVGAEVHRYLWHSYN
jgi:transposase-like protein